MTNESGAAEKSQMTNSWGGDAEAKFLITPCKTSINGCENDDIHLYSGYMSIETVTYGA